MAGLRLTLHESSSTVYPVRHGVPFLGFRLYPDRRRLKRRNGVMLQRRLACAARAHRRRETGVWPLWQCYLGWEAHACHADTTALRAAVLDSQSRSAVFQTALRDCRLQAGGPGLPGAGEGPIP